VVLPENAINFLRGQENNTTKQVLIQINQDKSLCKTIKRGNSNFLDTSSGQNN